MVCMCGVVARMGCPYAVLTLEFSCQHLHVASMCFDVTRWVGCVMVLSR